MPSPDRSLSTQIKLVSDHLRTYFSNQYSSRCLEALQKATSRCVYFQKCKIHTLSLLHLYFSVQP